MDQSALETSRLWHGKTSLVVLILLALGLTIGAGPAGVFGAYVIAIAAALVARRHGSFRDMGFRSPSSWARLVSTTAGYGIFIQVIFTVIIEPWLSSLTGQRVDVSLFDPVRGNFVNFLLLLAIGWIAGGFLEEVTFRGFVVGRIRWLLGSGTWATWAGVLTAAIAFGVAHLYQGITGMIGTGLIGFILGVVYVHHRFNIWYAVFTHGFINTFGIAMIYADIDRQFQDWLLRV